MSSSCNQVSNYTEWLSSLPPSQLLAELHSMLLDLNTVSKHVLSIDKILVPSGLISGLSSMHFPPFWANAGSGSNWIFVILSSFSSSSLFSNSFLNLEMFLGFAIRAAAMGIVLEKSARFRVALAERTIGGRKRDMASDLAAKLASYDCNVSEVFENSKEWAYCHGCIFIWWLFMSCMLRETSHKICGRTSRGWMWRGHAFPQLVTLMSSINEASPRRVFISLTLLYFIWWLSFKMSIATKKRTLDAFFKPPPKKVRISEDGESPKSQESNVELQVSSQSNLVPTSDQIRYYLVTPRTLFQYQISQKSFQKSWLLCLPQLVEKSRTRPILIFSTLNPSSQSISNDKYSYSCVRSCLSTE